jgi:hypothetical protein
MVERIPAPPVAEPCPSTSPSLTGLIADVERLLGEAATVPIDGLDDEALGRAVAGVARLESRAVALRMALTAEADRRRVAEQTAETGTDAWVARLTGSSREQAASGLWLAGLLQDKYAPTRVAFAAGDLRVDQVRVIVHAAEQAPAEATVAQVAAAEQWLVDRATGAGTRSGRPLDAQRLRQAARRMFACVDAELAARHQAILLGRETRSAQVETYLGLHDNGNGTFTGRFVISELHGHLLKAALDRLCAPRRLARDQHGDLVVDQTALGTGNGASICETHGAAFCELIEHLPTTGWPGHGGNGCEVIVTLDLDTLLTGPGAAGLDGGVAISAGEARRLACTAGIIPAVLDGASMPLDLGRTRRLHSRSQRRALALTHHTCAIAGCTRPFAWCEIHHHRIGWAKGGATDLDNGLPLCGWHHYRAHDTRYQLRQRPDGDWTLHRRT